MGPDLNDVLVEFTLYLSPAHYPANIYLFKANNRNIEKGVK